MNPFLEKIQRGPNRGSSLRRARVEIIPLIDVMFLLVAFFMVISISLVAQKGIFVDLSPAETADSSDQDQNALTVSVSADGELFFNKVRVTSSKLSLLLSEKAESNKDTSVVINADRDARHENVIEALDIVRKSQLHNVVFSVEPKE